MIWEPPPLWIPPKPAIIRPYKEPRQASILPGWFPGITKRAPAEISFVGTTIITTDLTTYTFTAHALGAVDATRRVVVVVFTSGAANRTLNSGTINGVAATIHLATVGAGVTMIGIMSALVPTGTTGDIVFTMSAGVFRARVAVYRSIGELLTTPHAQANTTTFAGAAISTTINVPDGWLIAAATGNGGGASKTTTWAGVTEDQDNTLEDVNITASSGSQGDLSVEVARAVSATFSATPTNGTLAAISWE